MSEQEHVRVIKDAYDAFRRGDVPTILGAITDDVEWETQGPPQIPYAGKVRGKEAVAQFFRTLSQTEDVEAFEPKRFFADGDMVVVLGHYAARVKTTGRKAEADWVHTFTFRGDKVAKYCEYMDTAAYAKAYAVPATV